MRGLHLLSVFLALAGPFQAFAEDAYKRLVLTTFADARLGLAEKVDLGKPGESPGDMFIFDQPLLDADGSPIGTNAGFCMRITPGQFSECQWTLAMARGSITVAGREYDHGTSLIPVIGGTGDYADAQGVLATTPKGDRTYEQKLTLSLSPRCYARGSGSRGRNAPSRASRPHRFVPSKNKASA